LEAIKMPVVDIVGLLMRELAVCGRGCAALGAGA